MSRKLRPMKPFAVFPTDSWTEICDQTAARNLRRGYLPEQLDPTTGEPVAGFLDRPDPDLDPSVAESALYSSDEELLRLERRRRVARVIAAVVITVGTLALAVVLHTLGGGW